MVILSCTFFFFSSVFVEAKISFFFSPPGNLARIMSTSHLQSQGMHNHQQQEEHYGPEQPGIQGK